MTILEFAIIAFMLIEMTANPPIVYTVDYRPTHAPREARNIPLMSGADSILLHLPRVQ